MEEFRHVMFLLPTQLQHIPVQEHLLFKISLVYLTITSWQKKPNGPIMQFVSFPINSMWIRATIIYLWDIWYDTHNKWIEELIGYSVSVFVILSGSLLTSNFSISQPGNKGTKQFNLSKYQVKSTSFTFLFTPTPIQKRFPLMSLLW